MPLNLRDYQLKIDGYIYRLIYMKHMVATNQKLGRDTQKIKTKNPNITLKEFIKPQWKKPKEEDRNREELQK